MRNIYPVNGKDADIHGTSAVPDVARLALFLSSSSLSLPLSPASLPSSPLPSSSLPSPPSLTSCIFIIHASRKLARAAGSKGERKERKEKERNVCTRKGRVSGTRYVLWSRNAGSTWSPYFRLISVMRNTNPRIIKMPGTGGGCCPYTTMSRLLIEIMSSVHLHTFHRFVHPTTFPLCAIKRSLRFALLDGTNN